MTIAENSREAYHELEPVALNRKQRAILNFLKRRGPMSDSQLSEATGWPKNEITPRRGELRAMGLIVESHVQLSQRGRKESVWKAVK